MSKTPGEFARWVRQVHEVPDDRPVDLDRLVVRCGGVLEELDLVGCSGALLPLDGIFGITVRQSDSKSRKRFTVAHELGHFCIPSHMGRAVQCVSPELIRGESAKPVEREANEFAAELLMPAQLVRPMVAVGSVDLDRAAVIANQFEVSRVSAALRMCEITRERAAVLYFKDGVLKWAKRLGLPYGLPPSGAEPSGDTIAYDLMCGKAGSTKAQEVNAGSWLPLSKPDPSWGTLLESSQILDGPGEVLTVLWLTMAD